MHVPGSILGTTMIELNASPSSVPQIIVRDGYQVRYYRNRLTGPLFNIEAQLTTCTTWYITICIRGITRYMVPAYRQRLLYNDSYRDLYTLCCCTIPPRVLIGRYQWLGIHMNSVYRTHVELFGYVSRYHLV